MAQQTQLGDSPLRAYKFPAATSCRICFSSESSATSRLSLAFSCSSALGRFARTSFRPPYSFRQRLNVCSLMPAYRHACGVVLPLAITTSTWRSSVIICSALYLLVGIPALLPAILSHSRWYKNPRSGQFGPVTPGDCQGVGVFAKASPIT